MRKTSLRFALDDFDDTQVFYEDLITRITTARYVIRHKYEKTEVFEAFVLRLAAIWEWLAEELFVAILNRDSSKYAEFRGLKLRKHL